LTAKEFLDAELAKYETKAQADKNISLLFATNSQFQHNKQYGVGRDTILKFLGGNWKGWMVLNALICKHPTFGAFKAGGVEDYPPPWVR
jgi:hypothetical protein